MISMQAQSDGTKLLQKTKQTGERYFQGIKLREFHFKFTDRLVVTKKELFRFMFRIVQKKCN